ncbi:unnamed protein product [Rhizopus stolonifer]
MIELDDSIGPAKSLIHCLVKIQFRSPCRLDGFPSNNKHGSGVIVDKKKGLVIVSRGIVPSSLGDVTITVVNSIVISAKFLFLHPTHNYSIVQYDPVALGDTNVMSALISDKIVSQGHEVIFVAYHHRHCPVFVRTVATEILCDTITSNETPRYRAMNQEVIALGSPIASRCSAGLLADQEGRIQALWHNFLGNSSYGHKREYLLSIHISTVLLILEQLRQGERDLVLRSLNVELMVPHMSSLYAIGLSDAWVNKIEEANPAKHQLFMVRGTEANSESAQVLKELDVLLAVNGKVATKISDFDIQYEAEELELTILRKKKKRNDSEAQDKYIVSALNIHVEPHQAVLQQSKRAPSQIYLTSTHNGSPACMYGLEETM